MPMHHSCGLLIKQINDAIEKRANNSLRSQGLTMIQMAVLLRLSELPDGQASLKELERFLRVAQSTTAGIVARLEQKGLVEGFGDSTDKRIKMVRITAQGEQCCVGAKADMTKSEEALLSGLKKEERDRFRDLLLKVANSME